MKLIKEMIKNSWLYRLITQRKRIITLKQWTDHDQEMMRFYSQFINGSSPLCFDVGANVGNRVKIFLSLNAVVVAIEPQRHCVGILKRAFGDNARLTIVQKAVGETEGQAEILMSDADTISSMSPKWIEAVKKSGRFPDNDWYKKVAVPMTTLDSLIEEYGKPDFIKIDVEGYEYQVISGLSQPVRAISIEFTPEFIDSTFSCIDHLEKIGNIRLNYSLRESMSFALADWTTSQRIKEKLIAYENDNEVFGDVYVRFED